MAGWGSVIALFDARDQLVALTDPGYPSANLPGVTTSLAYDARRLLVQQTNGNGTSMTLAYDALGRNTQRWHATSSGTPIEHQFVGYDAVGRPLSRQSQASASTFGYDPADRLLLENHSLSGLTTNGYDLAGRRILQQTATTFATALYDAADQLLSVQASNGSLTTLAYDANGSTLSKQKVDGTLTTFAWDAANRLASVLLPTGGLYRQLYRYDDLRVGQVGPQGQTAYVYEGTDVLAWQNTPPATPPSAAFLATDTATQGSWKGKYGADGYHILVDTLNYPPYATLTATGTSNSTWAASTSDVRALQKAASSTDRIAACWNSSTSFTLTLTLTDGKPHQVSLYCLDWDNAGRAQTVSVLDAVTGATLDTRSVSSFVNGTYLSWRLSGAVLLRVQTTGGPNGVISGLFFDAPPPSARFVGSDFATEGNWKGVYGADGHNVIADSIAYPAYASVTATSPTTYTWAASTSDGRALQKAASATDRIAACWYDNAGFTVDLNLTDGQAHQVSVYCLGWDLDRTQTVSILNAATGATLDTQTITAFRNGQYLSWLLSGHVQIHLTASLYQNCVLSGLFFDPSGAVPSGQVLTQGANLIRAVGSTRTGSALARQYHLDPQGSVQATTTGSQATETTYVTDAWGNVLAGNAPDNPAVYLGGLGYWNEPLLGLDYVRARWLDPTTGQWLSVDPVSTEPRYLYARNSPTFRTDPSGKRPPQQDKPAYQGDEARFGFLNPLNWPPFSGGRSYFRQTLATLMQLTNFTPGGFIQWYVDSFAHSSESVWRWQVEGVANIVHQTGLEHWVLEHVGPALVLTPSKWKSLTNLVSAPNLRLLPPYPLTGDFIAYVGGFVYGYYGAVGELIGQVVKLANPRPFHNLLTLLYYLSERHQTNLWQDVSEMLRQGRSSFLAPFTDLYTKHPGYKPYDYGKMVGRALMNIILLLIPYLDIVDVIIDLLRAGRSLLEIVTDARFAFENHMHMEDITPGSSAHMSGSSGEKPTGHTPKPKPSDTPSTEKPIQPGRKEPSQPSGYIPENLSAEEIEKMSPGEVIARMLPADYKTLAEAAIRDNSKLTLMSAEQREVAARAYEAVASRTIGPNAELTRLYNLERARFFRGQVKSIPKTAAAFGKQIGYNR